MAVIVKKLSSAYLTNQDCKQDPTFLPGYCSYLNIHSHMQRIFLYPLWLWLLFGNSLEKLMYSCFASRNNILLRKGTPNWILPNYKMSL